ncbi:MAG: DnaJ domain-containing protein [Cyanobacteria bacterium J06632_3]
MTIEEGLFQLDMTDHHAVLGFSLAAEPSQVRKRYLKVARKLHPDSLLEATPEQQKLASELLSKQVNPAYEALSQEKSSKEHYILLKMKHTQLAANPQSFKLNSNAAKNLLNSKSLEADYEAALAKLSAQQFDNLERVEVVISEISELNAAYLMRKPASTQNSSTQSTGGAAAARTTNAAPDSTSGNQPPTSTFRRRKKGPGPVIESYLKRAKEFESQKDYSRGILELREAIASQPQSAPCHAYLAYLYLKSGQETLAKIHAKQALTFSPENEQAKSVQASLNARARKRAAQQQAQKDSKKGGGLLSGLFGGKKR